VIGSLAVGPGAAHSATAVKAKGWERSTTDAFAVTRCATSLAIAGEDVPRVFSVDSLA
jgi:hypothetical protein